MSIDTEVVKNVFARNETASDLQKPISEKEADIFEKIFQEAANELTKP